MNIYEEDGYINQLADEDAAIDAKRQQDIADLLKDISYLEDGNLQNVLRKLLELCL